MSSFDGSILRSALLHGKESGVAIVGPKLTGGCQISFELMDVHCHRYTYVHVWQDQSEEPNYSNFQINGGRTNELLQYFVLYSSISVIVTRVCGELIHLYTTLHV